MAPQLIFGTATFGMDMTEFQSRASIEPLLETLHDNGVHRLDTGARYPPLSPGRSEQLIGESKELIDDFLIDTKVYTDTKTDGSGDLRLDAIHKSAEGSLQRLQRPKINVLYAHRADPSTPLEEQIRGFNAQIQQGHCNAWGVSNTSPETLQNILNICEEMGLQKPSCYQGNYNLITRGMEIKLLPILRAHGMSFVGYGPLAAGFLTGKFVNGQHAGTRFDESNPIGKVVQNIYGAQELQEALKHFEKEVSAHGLTLAEVALRWVNHHSTLRDEDGIIFGASRTVQASETVALIRKGPLPTAALKATEELWDAVKETRKAIL